MMFRPWRVGHGRAFGSRGPPPARPPSPRATRSRDPLPKPGGGGASDAVRTLFSPSPGFRGRVDPRSGSGRGPAQRIGEGARAADRGGGPRICACAMGRPLPKEEPRGTSPRGSSVVRARREVCQSLFPVGCRVERRTCRAKSRTSRSLTVPTSRSSKSTTASNPTPAPALAPPSPTVLPAWHTDRVARSHAWRRVGRRSPRDCQLDAPTVHRSPRPTSLRRWERGAR